MWPFKGAHKILKYKLKQRMSRQKQISNEISVKKGQIKEIDSKTQLQTKKQQILDDLIQGLDLSDSEVTSSRSSIVFIHENSRPRDHTEYSHQQVQKKQAEASDWESINSENLSLEIDKIRLFQNQYKAKENFTSKIHITKQNQANCQSNANYQRFTVLKNFNIDRKGPTENFQQISIQFYAPELCIKNSKQQRHLNKVKFDEQKYLEDKKNEIPTSVNQKIKSLGEESLSQIQINRLIKKNENEIENQLNSNKTKKIAFLQSNQEQQKIRFQKLQEQKRLIRRKLLQQRIPKSCHIQQNYFEKEKQKINLNEIERYSQLIGKNIFSSYIDLEETMIRGKSKTKKYFGYIKKYINQMEKTQQKIKFYRKNIIDKY